MTQPASRAPTLLVAIDLSPASQDVLRHGLDLARRLSARVELVTVVRRFSPTLPMSRTNRTVVAKLQKDEVASAHEALRDLAATATVPVHTHVRVGTAHEEILEHARKKRARWIVVGKRGSNLTESLLIGSTADRVLRKATTPVVVVPTHRAARSHARR